LTALTLAAILRGMVRMEEHIYKYYEFRRTKQQAAMVTSGDYKEMIDMALDKGDFRWAKELVEKMVTREKYKRLKESWSK
jgi:hypothetical protein